jgi:hypothetical protein
VVEGIVTLPVFPSTALPGGYPLTEPVAVTGFPCARFVPGGGVTTPPAMLTCPVSRRSIEDAPTETVCTPEALVHAPFQYWKLRASSEIVTCCV